jgi:hypothetical protein
LKTLLTKMTGRVSGDLRRIIRRDARRGDSFEARPAATSRLAAAGD